MNCKRLGIIILLSSSSAFIQAQNSVENALNSIKQNNKTINSMEQYVVATNLENRTGLTLENPSISADYMIGRPVAGGNQLDFLAVQGFDFPSTYSKKKQLAGQQEQLLLLGKERNVQDILLEAKLVILEVIHLNQHKIVLGERKLSAENVLVNYQYKFDLEQISALDLNKAKIQLLNLQNELRSVENQISIQTHHLTELNGGVVLTISDENYPLVPTVPNFESLNDTIESHDPNLKWLMQQKSTFQSQIDVRKAMALPTFELGYHYQSVLGQRFNGVHFGVTVPLWENKNTVKASLANLQYGESAIEEHTIQHYFEIKEYYQNYENLKRALAEYKAVMDAINSKELLTKSFELGEMNFITYSTELYYYYNTLDQYAQLNLDYQKAVAYLFKYQL